MSNHYSALKRAKQVVKRTRVNQMRKTRLRHTIRTLRQRMAENDTEGAQALLPGAFSLIDRAAKWGIIKDNAAARYKSRLHIRMKKLSAA